MVIFKRSSLASCLILRVILEAGVEHMVGQRNDMRVKLGYKSTREERMMISVVKLPY